MIYAIQEYLDKIQSVLEDYYNLHRIHDSDFARIEECWSNLREAVVNCKLKKITLNEGDSDMVMNSRKDMRAVVLFSGGLDSTTCLAHAINFHGKNNVAALSIRYGQKHVIELTKARYIADKVYGVPLHELDLSKVFEGSSCALLSSSDKDIPEEDYATQLEKLNYSSPVQTYVPFRNGLMLAAAASKAMSIFEAQRVILYIAAHRDDAAGNAYPDCSQDFVISMAKAIEYGTDGIVTVDAPFIGYTKAEIVAHGIQLGVPYQYTYSCYEGGEQHCGVCGTCRDRKKAFELNNAQDPTFYLQ